LAANRCVFLFILVYIRPDVLEFTTGPGSVVIDGDTEVLRDVSFSCRFTVPDMANDMPLEIPPVELLFITSCKDIVRGT